MQWHPQESQGQVSSPSSKVIEPTFHAHAHLPLIGSKCTEVQIANGGLGHSSITKDPKVKVISTRSKVTGETFYTNAHLQHMGSLHAQSGQGRFNTLATAASAKLWTERWT